MNNVPAFDSTFTFSGNDANRAFVPGTLVDLRKAEEAFIQAAEGSGPKMQAYTKAVSGAWFVLGRNGQSPVVRLADVARIARAMPEAVVYKLEGVGIAKSNDLGYAYGNTVINGKADNYLRIWRRENQEWKLVLEALRY